MRCPRIAVPLPVPVGNAEGHRIVRTFAAPPAGSIHPQATFSDSATGKLYYVDVDNFVSVASEAAGGGRRQRERAAALLAKLVVVEEEEMEATEAEEKGAKGQQ